MDELTWRSAWEIRELVAAGKVSPVEVTEHFLARIEQLDGKLHAFDTVNRDALEQAKRLEESLGSGEEAGPLCGVPVAVKPGISIEGLAPTTPTAQPQVASRDDVSIERLRRAGAVIAGITTVPSLESPASARNPWDLARTPGSSTAGGSVAAAAGLVPISIGTDGAGSIRLPAAYNGTVGLHPTIGRIPWVNYVTPGVMSWLVTSQGPLCYDVRDAAIALQVMAGPDGRDIACLQDRPDDYLATLDAGVSGMRFAWVEHFGSSSDPNPDVVRCSRAAAEGVAALGSGLEETTEDWESVWSLFFLVLQILGPAFGERPDPAPGEWERAVDVRARTSQRFERLFDAYDVVLSPTTHQIAPVIDEERSARSNQSEEDRAAMMSYYFGNTVPFNLLRFPAITVPCGFVDGMPVGLQIGGPAGSEQRLLRVARAFQQAFPRPERPTV